MSTNGTAGTSRGVLGMALVTMTLAAACAKSPFITAPSAGSNVLTIERVLNGTREEAAAFARLEFALEFLPVQVCMRQAGYTDGSPARMFQGVPPPNAEALTPSVFEVPDLEFARTSGWGIVANTPVEPPPASEDQDDLKPKAYREALDVCSEKAEYPSAAELTHPADLLSPAATEDMVTTLRTLDEQAEFLAVEKEYQSCLEAAGYPNFSLDAAVEDLVGREAAVRNEDDPDIRARLHGQALADEIQVAAAEAECRAPLVDDFIAARTAHEAPVIEKYQDEVDAVLAAWPEILDRAPSREEVAAGVTRWEQVEPAEEE